MFFRKNPSLNKIYAKTEQNMRNLVFTQNFKPPWLLEKYEIQKNLLIPNSTLDELFSDTTHISLRWIYGSAKIVWTKKTHLST